MQGYKRPLLTSDGGLNQRLAKMWREFNGFTI